MRLDATLGATSGSRKASPVSQSPHGGSFPPPAQQPQRSSERQGGFPSPQQPRNQGSQPQQRQAAPAPRPTAPQQNQRPPARQAGPSTEGEQTAGFFAQISEENLRVVRPDAGFRGALFRLTGGRINLGLGRQEQYVADLISSIQRSDLPSSKVFHIAVWSQKGGVGKTSTTVRLGATLASNRTDRVLALDVNPDGGSLAVKVPRTTARTILDLRDALKERYVSPAEFDDYTNKSPYRLDSIVHPPGKKPQPGTTLTGNDYLTISKALAERHSYKFIVTDCGTNLSDSVMEGVLRVADQLVVLAPVTVDESTVTAGGLEALMNSGHADLVRNAVTVMVDKAGTVADAAVQKKVDEAKGTIRQHFESLTRQTVSMPFDPSLFFGGAYNPEAVSEESRTAELELAKAVVDGLATSPRRRQ